jgi:hypothetical protein
VEHQEVPNKKAAVETIGSLEDWSGDQLKPTQKADQIWWCMKKKKP